MLAPRARRRNDSFIRKKEPEPVPPEKETIMSSPPSVNRSLSSAAFGQQVDAANAAAAEGQLAMEADFVDAGLQEKVEEAEARGRVLLHACLHDMYVDHCETSTLTNHKPCNLTKRRSLTSPRSTLLRSPQTRR